MGLTYTVNEDARPIVANLIKLFYPELREAGVTFDILECSGGLKFHGYSAGAIIKVNSLKDRVSGLHDCRVLLNSELWVEADKKRRQALLDHELYHLEVVREDDGTISKDDCGRPKLRCKLHDFQIGGFRQIIDRNKEHSLEAQYFAFTLKELKQIDFDWDAAELMCVRDEEVAEKEEQAA